MIDKAEMIARVSAYLTDDEPGYEFTHWTERDLATYFDMALKLLAIALPEVSRGTCVVQAQAGSATELPPCCETLLGLVGVRVNGQQVDYRPRRTSVRGLAFAPLCNDNTRGKAYRLDSWSFDPEEGGQIYLTPAVPDDVNVELTLQCVKPLQVLNGKVDIPAKYDAIIFEFMLYYAWGIDIESAASRDRSAAHYKVATDLLGAAANLKNLTMYARIPESLLHRGKR